MTSQDTPHNKSPNLRRRAEKIVRKKSASSLEIPPELSLEETQRALHELRVHQIELEMQNEELRRTQAELDAARARYFDLYELAPVGYCTLSEQGMVLEANLTVADLLGVPRASLLKQPLTRFIRREDQDCYYLFRRQLLASGERQECDLRMVKGDGAPIWVKLIASVVPDAGGAPVCRVVLSDISARKRAEEAAAAHVNLLQTTLDAIKDGITFSDEDGHFLIYNSEMERLTGYSRMEANASIDFTTLIYPDPGERRRAIEGLAALREKGTPYQSEATIRTKEGEARVFLISSCIVHFQNRSMYLTAYRDITERKRAEGIIRETALRFHLMLKTHPHGIIVVNNESRVEFANQKFCDYLGLQESPEALVGLSSEQIIGKVLPAYTDPATVLAKINAAVTCDVPEADYEIATRDGRVLLQDYQPLVIDGQHTGRMWIQRDITERKQAEETLRESNARFQTIFNTAADGMFIHDLKNERFYLANPACLRMLGYTMEEFNELEIANLHPAEDLPFIREQMFKFSVLNVASRAEIRFKRKDGSILYTDLNPAFMTLEGRNFVLVTISDITERKEAEAKQRTYEQELHALMEQINSVEEQTRQYIAMELHDQIGQVLALIKIQLDKYEALATGEKQKLCWQEIGKLIQHTLKAVRSLSFELCPPLLIERGLSEAVRWFAEELNSRDHLKITVKVPVKLPPIERQRSGMLYWIIRELLMNVKKYAQAQNVTVRLGWSRQAIVVNVDDDGCGFTPAALDVARGVGHGFGLFSIRERLRHLGGELEVVSAPGAGTHVKVSLPLP